MDRSHHLECSYEVAWGHLGGIAENPGGRGFRKGLHLQLLCGLKAPANSPIHPACAQAHFPVSFRGQNSSLKLVLRRI